MRTGRVLLLWDVDHTLIDNGGVSKANYALAFELLTGRPAEHRASTDGRTDVLIVRDLLGAHGVSGDAYGWSEQEAALIEAGSRNRVLLGERGSALPGAAAALERLGSMPGVIQSALTGNVEPNARVKLGTFGLDRWVDFTVGAFGSESEVRAHLVPIAQGKAAERHGFNPATDATVLIGDTVRDVEAGLNGGAHVIAVATGGSSVDELRAAGASCVLESLTQLDDLVAAVESLRDRGAVRAA